MSQREMAIAANLSWLLRLMGKRKAGTIKYGNDKINECHKILAGWRRTRPATPTARTGRTAQTPDRQNCRLLRRAVRAVDTGGLRWAGIVPQQRHRQWRIICCIGLADERAVRPKRRRATADPSHRRGVWHRRW